MLNHLGHEYYDKKNGGGGNQIARYIHVAVILCLNADFEVGYSERDILRGGEGFGSESEVTQVIFTGWVDVAIQFIEIGNQWVDVAGEFFGCFGSCPG